MPPVMMRRARMASLVMMRSVARVPTVAAVMPAAVMTATVMLHPARMMRSILHM